MGIEIEIESGGDGAGSRAGVGAGSGNFLIAIIVGAIVDFIVGVLIGPINIAEVAKGFVGFSAQTFSSNFKPDFRLSERVHYDFFSVFAIFFPSVTGIQAGANISGDLKASPTNSFVQFTSTGSSLVSVS
ncbi:Bumetanide-sensitive sodium-(potassium)-chloride cotransporter [Eumeta japonica]|uniref:Bumetanide-sensitive sodium-(Potassium)-chloride cotransporter n=1 Tax=Eumeta variegata TaxID=151549 RepID=A0A4C1SZJ3_EUMVA|nr:Bumetanide-sensitive sodium-(potassium)-chloride cotransporter [Eumeta japonica]